MYVVTGATGNTGKVAAQRLLAQGQKVRVIGRSAERLQSLAAAGAEPFVADITDAEELTRAFSGAKAVYAMIPPNMATQDLRADQRRMGQAIAQALQKTGVKHVVTLSSIGADKNEKTGPVVGLHEFEETLNQIPGLNVLHLRPGYFMENTLGQVSIIRSFGMVAGPLRPDRKVPLIATQDIGAAAADALLKLNFTGHQTRELLGPRDLDYDGITAIIGKAINKPDLKYVNLPDQQIRPALLQLGMSGNLADLLLEMSASMNSGHMKALEKRSPGNSTPTTYETFATNVFAPLFQGQSQAA